MLQITLRKTDGSDGYIYLKGYESGNNLVLYKIDTNINHTFKLSTTYSMQDIINYANAQGFGYCKENNEGEGLGVFIITEHAGLQFVFVYTQSGVTASLTSTAQGVLVIEFDDVTDVKYYATVVGKNTIVGTFKPDLSALHLTFVPSTLTDLTVLVKIDQEGPTVPIEGALVKVFASPATGQPLAFGYTDENGEIFFPALARASRLLYVTAVGYVDVEDEAVVLNAATISATVTMIPEGA
jgi:hypothetical protein